MNESESTHLGEPGPETESSTNKEASQDLDLLNSRALGTNSITTLPDIARPTQPSSVAPRKGHIPFGVTFNGTIVGGNSYEVAGAFEGSMELQDADLEVVQGATMKGSIVAKNALVSGAVDGEVRCESGCVTFTKTARCEASLAYMELVVDRGAKVNAQLRSTGEFA